MSILKSIALTISFYIIIVLASFWVFLFPEEIQYSSLIEVYHVISSILLLLILVLFFKLIKRHDLLVLKETSSYLKLLAILLGVGFVFFQSFLNIIYYWDISLDFLKYEFTPIRLTNLRILAAVLFTPILEELFFRNYIQRELTKNYKPQLSILVTSLLFASIHIPFISLLFEYEYINILYSFNQTYITLFGGIIAGILFYKSKSIVPSILFHASWNLTVFIF